jgi:hypothetical protein
MKITNDIIRGVLSGVFNENQPIVQGAMVLDLYSIASLLTLGLNDIIGLADQMEHLKRKQADLDSEYVECTDDIKAEVAQLQEECPHFSHSERPIEADSYWSINICDICGKHLEGDNDDIQS